LFQIDLAIETKRRGKAKAASRGIAGVSMGKNTDAADIIPKRATNIHE
jgi:hypothetical protein